MACGYSTAALTSTEPKEDRTSLLSSEFRGSARLYVCVSCLRQDQAGRQAVKYFSADSE